MEIAPVTAGKGGEEGEEMGRKGREWRRERNGIGKGERGKEGEGRGDGREKLGDVCYCPLPDWVQCTLVGTGGLPQKVKVLASKADNLGSRPEAHMVGGKNWFL